MTRIVGYTALRYGAAYFGWAIRSIIDYVDEFHVLYAINPSHGHYSSVPCPETEAQLHDIAWQSAGTKLRWRVGNWTQEGEQRNSILGFAPDATAIISVDSDEIYSTRLIHNLIQMATHPETVNARYIRVPFIHYWRSFRKCILHDPAYPARLTFPFVPVGEKTLSPEQGVVNHMGYATTPAIVKYKWQIHGHLSELRRDVNWFDDVFMANRQFDCHPVGSEHWNPETVDPLDYMPEWMDKHPFFNMKVIE
jgi:hypothetical protein